MKKYKYQDQGGIYTLTEAEILKEYYPYWSAGMKRIGKEHQISRENCITDWIVVHMAYEVD